MNKLEFKIALARKGITQSRMVRELNEISVVSKWTEHKLSSFVNGNWPTTYTNYASDAKLICDYLGTDLKTLFPELAKAKKSGNKRATDANVTALNCE